MAALTLTLTNAGLDRIAQAQLGQTVDLRVAQIALTDQVFVAAPTLTALPGDFRRLGELSGLLAGDHIVHVTALDAAEVGYGARGFGLVLADGTLFATYSSPQRILEKTALTALAFAIDIAFVQPGVASLTFGATDFAMPPASTTRRGMIEIATQAEVDAGTDVDRAVTPAGVRAAFQGRSITGGGLATGGGDFSANRVITVAAATSAEGVTGTAVDRAMTPAATKAAIDAQVAGLVNGAPGGLDQLNELAAAIGNDPNFATTVNNALAGKVATTRKVLTTGLLTGGGDLSADRTLAVAVASAAEAAAGAINDKAVTPAALATIIATLAGKVAATRSVTGAGLASGGGDLTGDRQITVRAASAGDVAAGILGDCAVTPSALAGAGVVRVVQQSLVEDGGYRVWSDGFIESWGLATLGSVRGTVSITFPVAFQTACFGVHAIVRTPGGTINGGVTSMQEASLGLTGATLRAQNEDSSLNDNPTGFRWRAWGK